MKHAQLWKQVGMDDLMRKALTHSARLRRSFSNVKNLEDAVTDSRFAPAVNEMRKVIRRMKSNMEDYARKAGLSRVR